MRSLQFILYAFVISLSLNGCGSTGTAINALRPTEDNAPSVYESTTSYINLPIKIKVQDIENKVNQSLNGIIYEDSNIEDDDISMKVWKQMPIKLKNVNGKIQVLLPLKARAIFINYFEKVNRYIPLVQIS